MIPENEALKLPVTALKRHLLTPSSSTSPAKKQHTNKYCVATDSQSCLTSMTNPIKRHTCMEINTADTYKAYRDYAVAENVKFSLNYYIPSHVGLSGNEVVDYCVQRAASRSTPQQQANHDVSLSTIRSIVHNNERKLWYERQAANRHNKGHGPSEREQMLGADCYSNLKNRRDIPRSLQCLFSKYRLGVAESCGRMPRHLGLLASDSCRLCGNPRETIHHLLFECPGTDVIRRLNRLSPSTLQRDSPQSILKISQFDYWIRHTLDQSYTDAHFNKQYDKDLYECIQQRQAEKRKSNETQPLTDLPLKRRRMNRDGYRLIFVHPDQRNLFYTPAVDRDANMTQDSTTTSPTTEDPFDDAASDITVKRSNVRPSAASSNGRTT